MALFFNKNKRTFMRIYVYSGVHDNSSSSEIRDDRSLTFSNYEVMNFARPFRISLAVDLFSNNYFSLKRLVGSRALKKLLTLTIFSANMEKGIEFLSFRLH